MVQANACPALSSGNFIGAIDAGGSRSMKCVFDLIIDSKSKGKSSVRKNMAQCWGWEAPLWTPHIQCVNRNISEWLNFIALEISSHMNAKAHLLVKIAAITVVTVDSRVCLRGGELGGWAALLLAFIILATWVGFCVEILLTNVKCSMLFVNLLVPEGMLNARRTAGFLDWLWEWLIRSQRWLFAAKDLVTPGSWLLIGAPQICEGLFLSVLLFCALLVLVHHFVV